MRHLKVQSDGLSSTPPIGLDINLCFTIRCSAATRRRSVNVTILATAVAMADVPHWLTSTVGCWWTNGTISLLKLHARLRSPPPQDINITVRWTSSHVSHMVVPVVRM